MPTLDYSTAEERRIDKLRSVMVFTPTLVAIAIFVACCLFWEDSNAAGIVSCVILSAAEILTIVLLCIWRRRLHVFSLVGGWIVAGFGALFLGVVAAVNLGILGP